LRTGGRLGELQRFCVCVARPPEGRAGRGQL